MPKIPVYNRQVSTRGIPSVRVGTDANPEAFNAGRSFDRVLGAAEDLAGGITRVAIQERDKADRIRMEQAKNDLNNFELRNIYDAKTGAMQTRGEQAFGIDKTLNEAFKKHTQEFRQGLSSERQRIAYDGMVAERWSSIDKWAQRHMAEQTAVVEEATYEASIESSKEMASVSPDRAPGELARIKNAVLDKFGGIAPREKIDQEIRKHETDLHTRVIRHLLGGGSDGQAQSYFDAVKANIDPDRVDGLQETINTAKEHLKKAAIAQNEAFALNIVEKTGDFNSLPDSVKEALPRESRSAIRSYANAVARGNEIDTDRVAYHELATMPDKEFKRVNLFAYRDKLSDADWKKFSDRKSKVMNGKGDPDGFDGIRTEVKIVNDTLEANGFRSNPDPKKNRKEAEDVAEYWRSVERNAWEFQKRTGKKPSPEEFQKICDDLMLRVKVGEKFFGLSDKTEQAFKVDALRDVPPEAIGAIRDRWRQVRGAEPTDDQILRVYQKGTGGAPNGK